MVGEEESWDVRGRARRGGEKRGEEREWSLERERERETSESPPERVK